MMGVGIVVVDVAMEDTAEVAALTLSTYLFSK